MYSHVKGIALKGEDYLTVGEGFIRPSNTSSTYTYLPTGMARHLFPHFPSTSGGDERLQKVGLRG